MSRRIKGNSQQLVLDLHRQLPGPPVADGSKALVTTLADLLLQALQGSLTAERAEITTEATHERQDHA